MLEAELSEEFVPNYPVNRSLQMRMQMSNANLEASKKKKLCKASQPARAQQY